ncbi:MAG: hypothetical protein OEZ29_00420 [Candidatus Bathyarchaeota archaeon]|nr:hypothetical protein [Candidatus Bathyarchaeota archaeon]MDH5779042.1 hypothetical protein [Candidatus Bathyarchaeota archaeon]
MNQGSLWLLRVFLILAILFSGLEKICSYLIFNNGHAIEASPVPRLMMQTTGLLAGHILGFIISTVFIYVLYKISTGIDQPIAILVGAITLTIAFSMYLSVFLHNLKNLQTLEALM